MNQPLISVIMPAFNAAKYIALALDSIVSQLYPHLEIIVVNDGSTDDSREIILDWTARMGRASHFDLSHFKLIDQENSGPGQARNAGIDAAHGDYIAFLDADDLWAPHSLEIRLEELKTAESDAVLGLTQAFITINSVADAPEVGNLEFFGDPFRFLNVGAGLFKSDAFKRNGNFSPSMKGSEDVDWFLRARDSGLTLQPLEKVTLWYRRHENNVTRGQSLANLDFHLALKRSLDRRRATKNDQTLAPFEREGDSLSSQHD